jgi:hypothetical protein
MSISVGTKSLDEPGVTRNKQKNKMQSQNAINTHQGKCQSKDESPSSNGWENAHLNKYFSFFLIFNKQKNLWWWQRNKEIRNNNQNRLYNSSSEFHDGSLTS